MIRLCSVDQLDDKLHRFTVGDQDLCVTKIDGEVFAISEWCTHQDVSLADGERDGYAVECFLHGARFDLRTGAVLTPPATQPVRSFPTRIEGNDVLIEIER